MARLEFKTEKGTLLPLLNLKGKEYLQVPHRLVWFREEKPLWRIETQLLEHSGKHAISRAVIKDEHGNIMSTAHKSETVDGFPDFIEKSETGAIGRALLLIGYGTAFCADELDERNRLADTPVDPVGMTRVEQQQAPSKPEVKKSKDGFIDPREVVISFGKYDTKKMGDIPFDVLVSYYKDLVAMAKKNNEPLTFKAKEFGQSLKRLQEFLEANNG